jgi:hypothetical protein
MICQSPFRRLGVRRLTRRHPVADTPDSISSPTSKQLGAAGTLLEVLAVID